MKYTFTLVLSQILFSICYCQDSLPKKIQFNAGFESYATQQYYGTGRPAGLPDRIKKQRLYNNQLPVSFDTATDNPLIHGAMYAAVKTNTTVAGKLKIHADLYGEYRGFSYGTFNKNNLMLFPVIEISGKDTLHFGRQSLMVEGRVGQFLNEKLDEGLMIYNIDLQGTQAGVRYKNTQLTYTIYGDLVNAIGLLIDDLHAVSLQQKFKNDSAVIGGSWVMAVLPFDGAKAESYVNLFGHIHCANNLRLFAQISYKPRYPDFFDLYKGFNKQIAFVAGIEKQFKSRRFFATNKTEVRYYGLTYNFYNYDGAYRYRNPVKNGEELYANTTGDYLYPLRKFQTPFSQWAVFTEYTDCNVWGITSAGECDYELANKLNTNLQYDINAVFAKLGEYVYLNPGEERTSRFVYPFFKASLRYSPLKECFFSFYLSNKTMNLDVHYPTHYLLKKPFAGLEVFCKL
jgi:hypothetical protein